MNSEIDISDVKLNADISANDSSFSAVGSDTDIILEADIAADDSSIETSLISDTAVISNAIDGTSIPVVTNRHDELLGRYLENQHPISAITGLSDELTKIEAAISGSSDTRVVDISVEYYRSTSYNGLIGGSWSSNSPGWTTGIYIWTRTKYTYENGTIKYSEPACYTGATGKDGKASYVHFAYANSSDGSVDFSLTNDESKDYLYLGKYTDFDKEPSIDYTVYSWSLIRGESGTGIKSTTPLYYCSDKYTETIDEYGGTIISPTFPDKPESHVTKPTDNQIYNVWTTEIPQWTNIFQYYFTCNETLYDDGTYEWSDVIYNAALQVANKVASEASNKADDNTFAVDELQTKLNSLTESLDDLKQTVADDGATTLDDIASLKTDVAALNKKAQQYEYDSSEYLEYYSRTKDLYLGSGIETEEESSYGIHINSESVALTEDGNDIAQIQNGQFLATKAKINTSLDIGQFRFDIKSDGGISLIWVSKGGDD